MCPYMRYNSAVNSTSDLRARLLALYDALHQHFGHEPHWWPIITDTPQFEIFVGAVLVQQTRWETVEAAIRRLHAAGLLAPAALAAAHTPALAALIRPCAFHEQKAAGLQAICQRLVASYGGTLAALLDQPRAPLRTELLALPRIGPETADTIMLYAGGHPVFIVDAYTRRLFARLDLVPGFDFARTRYDQVQALIEDALLPWTPDTASYPHLDGSLRHFLWDLHALIIEECIHHCLATNLRQDRPGLRRAFVDPRKCATHCLVCLGCPLRTSCATYQMKRET